MAKQGYCKECDRNVWLIENGSCQFGHSPDSIAEVWEVEPRIPEQVRNMIEQKQPRCPNCERIIKDLSVHFCPNCRVNLTKYEKLEAKSPLIKFSEAMTNFSSWWFKYVVIPILIFLFLYILVQMIE